ncbi:MAG: hypothetical protein V7651_18670 [Hyphomonas oceanitis]|uniref:hypothetical protein n=1 Tax=Hyphomonas oceanitis TaxID=81033 RepID=UPI003001457B
MSDTESGDRNDKKPPSRKGRRKDGKPFKDGNVREDGSYEVGRNRPPKKSQFGVDDGRKRGSRKKGVPNADTEFMEELQLKTTVNENGKKRRMTKRRSIYVRLINSASVKGEIRATEHVDRKILRIEAAQQQNRRYHTLGDEQILQAYLKERSQELGIDPDLFGDPSPAEDIAENGAEDGENGNG